MAVSIKKPREVWYVTNTLSRSLKITEIPSLPVIKSKQRIDLLSYASADKLNRSITIKSYITKGWLRAEGYLHTHDDKSDVVHSHKLKDVTDITATIAQLNEAGAFFRSTDITASEAEILTNKSNADSLHIHSFISDHNKLINLQGGVVGEYFHLNSSLYIAVSSLTNANIINWDLAHSHISSTGESHSFIDQSVVSGSSPVFNNTNMTGNVSIWTNDDGYIKLSSLSAESPLNYDKETGIFTWEGMSDSPVTFTLPLVNNDDVISIGDASTSVSGIVQLSDSYNGTSQTRAVTEKALTDGLATKQNSGAYIISLTISTPTNLTGFIKGNGFVLSADTNTYYKSGDNVSLGTIGAGVTTITKLITSQTKTITIQAPNDVYTVNNLIPITLSTLYALTITGVKISCNAAPATEITGDLKYADAEIGLANSTLINAIDTTAGVYSSGAISVAVAQGKFIYIVFDAAPSVLITNLTVEITYTF